MTKTKSRGRSNDDKVILKAKDSYPPPGYSRENHGFESDGQSDVIIPPPRVESKEAKPYSRSSSWEPVDSIHKHEIAYNHTGKIRSICLCSASVYPHYHGETIIDNNVYDEIIIIDPNELQTTTNKDVRLKGQCIRLCKLAIIIMIVFAGLACALYGVAHYFLVNKPSTAVMTRADVKLLQYSTYFCAKIWTDTSDIERKLTVLENRTPNIAMFNYNETRQLELTNTQSTYEQAFYAITQSVMRIMVQSKQDVHIMVFDDKGKLESWRNNKLYPAYDFREVCCKSVVIGRGVYTFKTKQDRQAFLVIYNPASISATVNLTVKFERTFIDYKRSSDTCNAKPKGSCGVPISFSSKDKVVVEIPDTAKPFEAKKVEWSCEARVWFYVLVFVGIFVLIVIILCIIYCIFKYCICANCCCCCCYIIPHRAKASQIVQYHKQPSYKPGSTYKLSAKRGPRAQNMRNLNRHDSNDSIDKRMYYTSDTSDDQGLCDDKKQLQRKSARRMSSNSTATSHSFASNQVSRRQSNASSTGSYMKRGLDIDDSYEELPPTDNAGGWSDKRNGAFVININDSTDGHRVHPRTRRIMATERATRNHDDLSPGLERKLRKKLEQFSDSEEEFEDEGIHQMSFESEGTPEKKQRHLSKSREGDDDGDYEYDVVGAQIASASRSTADVIDRLPLGPSGAPPAAPPKSAASIKGKPNFMQKSARNAEAIEILPNGMTRDKQKEKLMKSRSDAVNKNHRGRKQSPFTPNVIVVNGDDQRSVDIYSTYQRGMKNRTAKENGIHIRTISLDSGLDKIDGENKGVRRGVKPAADVMF